ncbi:MAG: site-2 protease family protein [Alphaproteobacteria bacterium]|nr:site-2 protease family protein [Alphaproteobacteria bacterium]
MWILSLCVCIVVHECAHAAIAIALGNRSIVQKKRLSPNPRGHISFIGMLVMPLLLLLSKSPVLFGWGRKVAVDQLDFKYPRLGLFLFAMAGPMANLVLAVAFVYVWYAMWLLPMPENARSWLVLNALNGVKLSLVMLIINMFPVLPLDGGKVVLSFLPKRWGEYYAETEKFGVFMILAIFFIFPQIGLDLIYNFNTLFYPRFVYFFISFLG